MTIKSLAAALACLAGGAGTALAATPFDGTWYFDCGDPEREATIIADDRIVSPDISCDILEVTRIGGEGQVWRTRTDCVEGDNQWFENVIFGLEIDVDGKMIQLVEIGMDEGYVLSYRRCE